MVITKDLGAVSAYAYAVEQGYQGTEEEFAELMARQATVAEEAAASADAAAESASEAQASAEQAEQSAQSISGDVERAEQAATTATGKATEAATSATTANGAAQTATGKAAQAEQSATAAANSASAAATSASNAASSATAAQTAQTAAETAQGKAEDAQAAAEAAAASIDPDTLVKKTELENYAKIDGSYETMTVGNAEQLVSTVGIEDSVPYNFRTAGGSADIGDRETDMVVGGTVAWNQLIYNGNFDSNARWSVSANDSLTIANNVATFRASARYHSIAQGIIPNVFLPQANHVYLGWITAKSYTNRGTFFYIRNVANATVIQTAMKTLTDTREFVGQIIKLNQTGSQIQFMVQDNNESGFGDITVEKAQMFDLTQMFGSTIADYIYSLEQATAGAGVAWFKKLFPKPYYEYNAGELLSVNASAHKMVGFNAWDEEWELGALNPTTGQPYSSSTSIRSKNFIPVLPNTAYCYHNGSGSNQAPWYYDAEKNFVKRSSSYVGANGVFTIPDNVHYMKFALPASYGTTYKNDICINLSWDGEKDGTYEPYELHSYALDSSLTLRGIPKLDSDNKLYYDGDTYESDGTVTRRYGIVDLGTLSWNKHSRNVFYTYGFTAKPVSASNVVSNLICSEYKTLSGDAVYSRNDGISMWSTSGNVAIYDSNKTDLTTNQFKTAMSGVMLVYELDTPTTESADPYQNPQIVNDFGTEEYVDAGVTAATPTRDVSIPVGHSTFYAANLRAKLEMAPDSPEGNGDYIVRQTDGENSYVPLVIPTELPANPSTDGTYSLKVTVSSGTATLSWVADV